MKLTQEQLDIIHSNGDIKINAVAGSGKTTTIIEYAKTRPKDSKILYLAFNKSVKLEAVKKFAEKGLDNVKVETAHSLAFKNIVYKHNYNVKPQSYKTHEIVDLLRLRGKEKHEEYILANHVNKFVAYFCNSDKQKVQDLNYLDVVSERQAKIFVKTFYKYIERQTRLLLSKMDNGEIEITHDFYLKKFQLSIPKLNYDYILFDEGQDASPAMLDIFLKQKATKVIVGDTHQQIYGWRFAVNSLEKANYKTYHLSTSFRFSQDIANLSMEVLKWKKHISSHINPAMQGRELTIHGTETNPAIHGRETKAVIARTNLGLLLKAIEYVMEKPDLKYLYFEGNFHSYTYADEGASLYDVLHLYNGNHHLIKDKLIAGMQNLYELEDYIKKTEDVQLGMMVEIVKSYGDEIPNILKKIKAKHVENDQKEKAEMIFSTVHRCKGMEYDAVQIVEDFLSEQKLLKQIKATKEEDLNVAKINEEINLLYVAVTRTKNSLFIPESLVPENFPRSPQIRLIREITDEEKMAKEDARRLEIELRKTEWNGTPYRRRRTERQTERHTMKEAREKNKNHNRPWTPELDAELKLLHKEGVSLKYLSAHFGRTQRSIISRIERLELTEITA